MNRITRRILHTSDLHLGSNEDKSCESLERIRAVTEKQCVDLVIIAGDLFDNNQIPDGLAGTVAAQLQEIGCPISILAGNHDCLTPGSILDRMEFWEDYNRIRIFRTPTGESFDWPDLGISIWGKSIDSEKEDVRPLKGIPEPDRNGHWNIAVAHGFYVDRYPALFPSYHITNEEISGLTWDYIALGHIPIFRHISSEPQVYYSGSPTYSNTSAIVELSEDNGVIVTCCEV